MPKISIPPVHPPWQSEILNLAPVVVLPKHCRLLVVDLRDGFHASEDIHALGNGIHIETHKFQGNSQRLSPVTPC